MRLTKYAAVDIVRDFAVVINQFPPRENGPFGNLHAVSI